MIRSRSVHINPIRLQGLFILFMGEEGCMIKLGDPAIF